MAWSVPWNLIGLIVSGDVGGYTIYTDRFGRKVPFPKAPPEKPPSAEQVQMQSNFRTAQAAWSELEDDEKQSLEDAVKILSMPLTGQNLWISVSMKRDLAPLLTVEQQSGLSLPHPVI